MWTQISNRLSSLDEEEDDEFVEFNDSWNHFHHTTLSPSSSSSLSLSSNQHHQPHKSSINESSNANSCRRMKSCGANEDGFAMFTKSSSGKLRDLSNVICTTNNDNNDDTNSNGKNNVMKCDQRRIQNEFETWVRLHFDTTFCIDILGFLFFFYIHSLEWLEWLKLY